MIFIMLCRGRGENNFEPAIEEHLRVCLNRGLVDCISVQVIL